MVRKLEIGSGNRPLKGYEHLDINPDCPDVDIVAPMDKIPIEDNIYDEITSIHVIEHQPWRKTLSILKEWIRILKPGGFIRIATPNLRWIAKSYLNAKKSKWGVFKPQYLKDTSKMVDEERIHLNIDGKIHPALWANFKIMSSGGKWDEHYACFDAELLCSLLKSVGCSKIKVDRDGSCLIVRAWK